MTETVDIDPKELEEIRDEIAEIEGQIIWSKEDQGRWKALIWALGIEDRTPPWERE